MVGHPYMLHGPGMLSRVYMTPAPRVNLQQLLSRNVPSMLSNYRRLLVEINALQVNELLERESSSLSADGNVTSIQLNVNGNSTRTPPLPSCPESPDDLHGRIFADINHTHEENYTEEAVLAENPELQPGGQWKPPTCHARHQVAIIVPFRDRAPHLMVLMAHLHPVLQRQQINYRIFVVEQYGNMTFNKARIMNIAFVTALKKNPYFDCFVFHDVDLIPEDDRNMYSCPSEPRHMSPAIDEMGYQIPYEELVGGVFAIRTDHFFKVNGYSNLYWGWGAEDDDMAYRLQHVGLRIIRPPSEIARYKMIRHRKRTAVDGRIRYRLLWTGVRRYKIDGINSLPSLSYKIMSVTNKALFTHILVDVGPPPPGF